MTEPVEPISDEGLAKLQASMERYPHSPEARALAPILARLDAERDARIAAEAKAERLGKDKHRLAVDRINVERERDAALARAVFDTEGDLLAQLGALRVENDRLRARAVPEGIVVLNGQRFVVELQDEGRHDPDDPGWYGNTYRLHPEHTHIVDHFGRCKCGWQEGVPDPQPVPVAQENPDETS